MKLLNTRTAGFVLVALLGAVMIFQILMAFGLPLQGATWGGQLDADPKTARIASFIASLILLFVILVVLEKLGVIRLFRKRRVINGILWFVAAYLLLNSVGNLLSPGGIERWVMTPLVLVASILCIIVARAPMAES
jgi:hypothetical protein